MDSRRAAVRIRHLGLSHVIVGLLVVSVPNGNTQLTRCPLAPCVLRGACQRGRRSEEGVCVVCVHDRAGRAARRARRGSPPVHHPPKTPWLGRWAWQWHRAQRRSTSSLPAREVRVDCALWSRVCTTLRHVPRGYALRTEWKQARAYTCLKFLHSTSSDVEALLRYSELLNSPAKVRLTLLTCGSHSPSPG